MKNEKKEEKKGKKKKTRKKSVKLNITDQRKAQPIQN